MTRTEYLAQLDKYLKKLPDTITKKLWTTLLSILMKQVLKMNPKS